MPVQSSGTIINRIQDRVKGLAPVDAFANIRGFKRMMDASGVLTTGQSNRQHAQVCSESGLPCFIQGYIPIKDKGHRALGTAACRAPQGLLPQAYSPSR